MFNLNKPEECVDWLTAVNHRCIPQSLVQTGVVLMTVHFYIYRLKPRNWRTPTCTWAWPPPNQRWRKETHRLGRTHRISAASPSAKTRFRSRRLFAPPNSHRTVRHVDLHHYPIPFLSRSLHHFLSFLYSFIKRSTNRINRADKSVFATSLLQYCDIFQTETAFWKWTLSKNGLNLW